MGTRRRAREYALQLLYLWEFRKEETARARRYFWRDNHGDDSVREFADMLVDGVIENVDTIDDIIKDASLNWRIDRMAVVDRNILRLATFELMSQSQTPLKVVLNEAIELSKRFSSEDSGAFVNGVLDKIGSVLRAKEG